MQTVRETLNEGKAPATLPERGSATFLVVVVMLALTLASIVFFKVANASLDRSIEEANRQIADIDASIAALESDHDIRAYNYYKNARNEVERSIRLSMAQHYITEFQRVSQKYGIDFSGFAFGDSKVTTSAQSRDRGEVEFDAVEKVSEMIREYRTGKDDSLFLLDPVMSVNGSADLRSFSVVFQIDEATVDKILAAETAPRRIIESASGTGSVGSGSTGSVIEPSLR
ncbi:MAG TPA: hypothetical protein PK765_06155 [bacterium]|nr:hypothetical protein [bacterium]